MCAPLNYFLLLFIFVFAVFSSKADNDTDSYTTLSPNLIEPFSSMKFTDVTPAPVKGHEEDPYGAFSGLLTECLAYMSYPCFQRKILVFLDRLDKKKKINIYGHWLELVRSTEPHTPAITESLLISRKATDEHTLYTLLDLAWEQFVDNRFIRIQLPNLDEKSSGRSTSYVDINFSGHTTDEVEGRGKKKKKKKIAKILLKVLAALGGIAAVKLILLKPILIKLIALKGLLGFLMAKISFISILAMLVQKLMMQMKGKMMMMGCPCKGGGSKGCGCGGGGYPPSGVSDVEWMGGGGGGGGVGGGGGGWDSSGGGGGAGGWSSGGGGGGGGGSGGGWDRSFGQDLAYSYYGPPSTVDPTKGDAGQLSFSSHNAVQNTYTTSNI